MGESRHGRKPWRLTQEETITSFENWRGVMEYHLGNDTNFAPYLEPNVVWSKYHATKKPTRGLVDDVGQAANKKTAVQKNRILEQMLCFVATHCDVIARDFIVKQSTSLPGVWQTIRSYYGFQASGAHFLDLSDIVLEAGERYESLYQRIYMFFSDNLVRVNDIQHHGEVVTEDEEMSPTIENTITWIWLDKIDKRLPGVIKQKFGTELRNKTLSSIKHEISQSLKSIVEELNSDDAHVGRMFASRGRSSRVSRPSMVCTLCSKAKLPGYNSHWLSQCPQLTESDRKFMSASARLVSVEYGEVEDNADVDEVGAEMGGLIDSPGPPAFVRRVDIVSSPVLNVFFGAKPIHLTIDGGATADILSMTTAKRLGFKVWSSTQSAVMVDGVSKLQVLGEVHEQLVRGEWKFSLDALVVKDLDPSIEVIAGIPFQTRNDIATRPKFKQIIIGGREVVKYDLESRSTHSVGVCLLRNGGRTVVLPGEYLEMSVATDSVDREVLVEPRREFEEWLKPQETMVLAGKVRVMNDSNMPVKVDRHAHVAQVCQVAAPEVGSKDGGAECGVSDRKKADSVRPFSAAVKVDPDQVLTVSQREACRRMLTRFDDVFDPAIGCYNGASGPIKAVVNIGPALPPQRKGRVPSYSEEKLRRLQDKLDALEHEGVLVRPDKAGAVVENLNLTFLVPKSNGTDRLVTAFGEVGKFCRPQPSLLPDVDQTLRRIGQWRYLIKTDLSSAFYQIPLAQESMRYCGVATPFKGIRMYTRAAMGMPGSETALEELMSAVLGDQVYSGNVVKIADDLYIGSDSVDTAITAWRDCLAALQHNGLHLSASKTVLFPSTTTVLGWVWREGCLSASPHRISALQAVSPPGTVKGLRSFLGAYRVLGRVLRSYSALLAPLEDLVAGKESRNSVEWSDDLIEMFGKAQRALSECRSIVLPRPQDELWIVTDGSSLGVAATLYVKRSGRLRLAGFFSVKLDKAKRLWLPCEIEALAIAAALSHFAPFLIQAESKAYLVTDSKACVQAVNRLERGQFSMSARVSTFLASVSRYQVAVMHAPGLAILPSDYSSRNPVECDDQSCQVCKFVAEANTAVVREVAVHDVISGKSRLPFTNRPAWRALQQECPRLRRVYAHLKQGTRPSKKDTSSGEVKRYLQKVTLAADNVLVVKRSEPLEGGFDRIVVPQTMVDGVFSTLHLQLSHPSTFQMKRAVARYFWCLEFDKAVSRVVKACHQCMAVKHVPVFKEGTTSVPVSTVGCSFAADVMVRDRQKILVLREYVTAYTWACVIADEKAVTVRSHLAVLLSEARAPGGSVPTVRVDPAPCFRSLAGASESMPFRLEIGREKNVNKNPVAEKAVQELGMEMVKVAGDGHVSREVLATAVSVLNSRVRFANRSARELWTQRDQFTLSPIVVDDQKIIAEQHERRVRSHPLPYAGSVRIKRGDVVFLKSERNKTMARSRYLVVDIDDTIILVRKFSGAMLLERVYEVPVSNVYLVPCVQVSSESDSGEDVDVSRRSGSQVKKEDEIEAEESDSGESGGSDKSSEDGVPPEIARVLEDGGEEQVDGAEDGDESEESGDEVVERGHRYPGRERRPPRFLVEGYDLSS